jgi:O-succinylbenzoic acid--CoA ligase
MQLQHALQANSGRLNAMRAILVGGAPVSYGLEQLLKTLKPEVYATFGMTETVSHIALQRLNGPGASGVYQVLKGIAIGQDDRGCLSVQGEVTNGQRLQTNDLVELLSPEQFVWLGRADYVINSGGVKVQLAGVEKAVEKYFYQAGINCRFVVVPRPHEQLGQQVVLVVESMEPLPEALRQAILHNEAGYFQRYEKPRKILVLEKFGETPTGKPDRRAIQAWVASQAE